MCDGEREMGQGKAAGTFSSVRRLTHGAVLAALAFVLMVLDIPIPVLFPTFLKMDLSDVPGLLGAFALGPGTGVGVALIKNLLHFVVCSSTGGVGELANFLTGASFAGVAGALYVRQKSRRRAFFALGIGTLAMTMTMAVLNYAVLFPFFFKEPPSPRFFPLIYGAVVPFNLLKGILVSGVVLLLYKKVSPILHRS